MRSSSILITGTAGTGKSSFAAAFVDAACARGERTLYFAFEESPSQILRNMSSIGIDLNPWIKRELLHIHAARPTAIGLEAHLAIMHKLVTTIKPNIVVMDPITNLVTIGDLPSVKAMLTRMIDFLKNNGITAMFTNLVFEGTLDGTAIGISSLMDTWLVLRSIDHGADRGRSLSLLKSRGMSHDTSTHEFTLSDKGISINGKQQTVSAKKAG